MAQQQPQTRWVWFQLVDAANDLPFKGVASDAVLLTHDAMLLQFRDAVKIKLSNNLSSYDAADLIVYRCMTSYQNNKDLPLKSSYPLSGLGITEEDPVIAIVPNRTSSHLNKDPNKNGLFVESSNSLFSDEGHIRKRQHIENSDLTRKLRSSQFVEGYNQEFLGFKWKYTNVSIHRYCAKDDYFELDADYLAGLGLSVRTLIMYCRPEFHQQFKFLSDNVMTASCLGWILGPPGTGKSTTTLAFVSVLPTLFPSWSVTWIHLSRTLFPVCVRFNREFKMSCTIATDDYIGTFKSILNELNGNQLVIIDGFVNAEYRHKDVFMCCHDWRSNDTNSRRLVIVSSMPSRGKTNIDQDLIDDVREFPVYSWTLTEYLTAVQNEKFWDSVIQNIDACNDSIKNMVIAKFQFAGGSSRFMFQLNTMDVINQLQNSIKSIDNVTKYLKLSFGDRSDGVINRLFSCYLSKGEIRMSIVSKYAATRLAIKEGPELIVSLAHSIRHDGNPSMDGWFLEMWFFASIRTGGVILYGKDGVAVATWHEAGNVSLFDVTAVPVIPDAPTWWKPIKWNQGGYDAILTEKNLGKFSIIQVTSGESHSFKIEYFYELVKCISESAHSYNITTLEIIFLVKTTKIETFEIGEVTGEGLLSPFGWEKNTEKERVKILGITGV